MMPLYSADSISSGMKGPDLPSVDSVNELSQLATVPNARYGYFDKHADYLYVVQTNENNYKTIRRFAFYEDPIPKPEDKYATKEEIMDLKGDIANVQQSIQQLIEQTRFRPKNKHGNGSGKADVQNGTGGFQSAADVATNGYEQSTDPSSLSNNISG